MTIRKDHRERQQGAHPSDAGGPRADLPTLPRGARPESGRSPSARMNGRSTNHAAGRPALAELSQYRAGHARGRAGASEHTENASGLPLMLDAVRAVVRDEFGELRRELIAELATGDEVLTRAAVAQFLHVSTRTVSNWIHTRGLPASKIGVEWRFRRSEVVRWMGEHHVS